MQVGQVYAALGLDDAKFRSGLKQAEAHGSSWASGFGGIIKTAIGYALGQGLFETIKSGFRTVTQVAFGFNSQVEQTAVSFNVLTRSADKTRQIMAELYKYSAQTPFEFPEVADAARILQTVNMEVGKWIRLTGDLAAANPGRSIQEVAMALSRIQSGTFGEGFEQLRRLAISKIDLEAVGLKFDKGGQFVGSVDEAMAGVEKIINSKFKGMAAEQGKTFAGMMSTLKDMAGMTLGTLFQPAFEGAKAVQQQLIKWLEPVQTLTKVMGVKGLAVGILGVDNYNQVREALAQLAPAVDNVKAALAGLKPIALDVWNAISTGVQMVMPYIPPLLEFFTGLARTVIEHWPQVKPIITGVLAGFLALQGTRTVTRVLLDLAGGAETAGNVLTRVLTTVKDVPTALQGLGKLTGISGLFADLKAAADLAKTSLATLAGNILTVVTPAFTALKAVAISAFAGMKNAAVSAFAFLAANPVAAIVGGIILVVGALYLAWTNNWGGIQEKTRAVIDWIQDKIDRFVNWFSDIKVRILTILGFAPEMYKKGAELGGALHEGLISREGLDMRSPSNVERDFMDMRSGVGYQLDVLDKVINSAAEKVKQGARNLAAGIANSLKAGIDTVAYEITHADALWELFKAQFTGAATSTEILSREQEVLSQRQVDLQKQINLTRQQIEALTKAKGANSEETRRAALDEIDLQIQLANTAKQLREVRNAQGWSSMDRDAKIDAAIGAAEGSPGMGNLLQGLRDALPNYAENLAVVSNIAGKDLSVGRSILDTQLMERFKKGELAPRFHAGGITPREMPILADKDEWHLPNARLQALLDRAVETAAARLSPIGQPHALLAGAGAGGPTVMVDVHDNVFRDGTDAGQQIREALRRVGL